MYRFLGGEWVEEGRIGSFSFSYSSTSFKWLISSFRSSTCWTSEIANGACTFLDYLQSIHWVILHTMRVVVPVFVINIERNPVTPIKPNVIPFFGNYWANLNNLSIYRGTLGMGWLGGNNLKNSLIKWSLNRNLRNEQIGLGGIKIRSRSAIRLCRKYFSIAIASIFEPAHEWDELNIRIVFPLQTLLGQIN